MNSRQLIFRIFSVFDKRPGKLERIIDQTLQGVHVDHRDRRLIFEIVYGIVRRLATLDYIIDEYVNDEKKRTDPLLRRMLRIGLYQLLYLDRIPDHAAVNETVKLAGNCGRDVNYTGIVNGVMRSIIKNKKQITYPDGKNDLPKRLSVEYSHPRWLISRWLATFGLAKTKKLLSFNNEKPSIYLRRTLRSMSRQQFEADARTICDSASGYMDLYYRLKKSLVPDQIQLMKQGYCTVQAPSSGWVVALLDVQRGDHVIDLCSAPGGKTALIADLTGNTGTVCASELHYNRLEKVVETMHRMRLSNVYPIVCDSVNPPLNGIFDKVLLDAPCSATGVLHRHPEARWIRTIKDIDRIVTIQAKLLDAAANLVGAGGSIVYATCSLEPEENEQQIEAFIKKHSEFTMDSPPECIPQQYIDRDGFLRITPFDHGLDGMFAAQLKRT
jgi:16S rRNA (cytosine967-C5)-methyltransferase